MELRIPEIILDPATPIKRKSTEFADNSTVHGRIAVRNHGRDGIIPAFNGGTVNRDDSNEKSHDCGPEKERIEPASAFVTRVQLGIHLANERRTNSECERSLVLFSRYITPKRIERSVRVGFDSLKIDR